MPEVHRPTAVASPPPREIAPPVPARDERWLQDEIDLADYGERFRRHWLLLVVGAIVGALAGIGIASLQPILYEGVTTLIVVPPAKTGGPPPNIANFRALVENFTLVSQTIDELRLNAPPHDLTPQRFIERALVAEEVRGSSLIKVRVRLGDPKLAADTSRRLADKAILLDRQLRREEGANVSDQLKAYVERARERLRGTEEELFSFKRTAQVELLKEDATAMLHERGALLRLVIEIESEKARLAAAETEIKKQQPILSVARAVSSEEALRRAVPRPDGDGEAAARGVTSEERLRRQPASATSGGSVDPEALDLSNPFVNPVYQTLDLQIATSRARLAALEGQRKEMIEVKGVGADQLKQLTELYSREINLARLQNNHDLAKRVYSDLAVRYEQTRAEGVDERARLQLVDAAIPPDRPVSRRRAAAAAVGFAAGVLAAALLALFLTAPRRVGARAA